MKCFVTLYEFLKVVKQYEIKLFSIVKNLFWEIMIFIGWNWMSKFKNKLKKFELLINKKREIIDVFSEKEPTNYEGLLLFDKKIIMRRFIVVVVLWFRFWNEKDWKNMLL